VASKNRINNKNTLSKICDKKYIILLTYLFAGTPTNLYPSSVKATIDGVVLWPIFKIKMNMLFDEKFLN